MLLVLFLIALIFGIWFVLFKSSFFTVKNIRITGTKSFVNQADAYEVVKEKVFGKSLFSFDTVGLEENLLDTFLGSKAVKVYKVYPGTISIEFQERIPLALVYREDSEHFMVDEDGYVLGIVDEERTNLPRIKYEGDTRVGEFVDKNMVPIYLELVSALSEQKVKVSSMSFYPKYARLYVSEGVETLISNDKNKSDSVKILSELLRQLGLEGKKVAKIDLRYDKVIVSYD